TRDLVRLLNEEDATVPAAVAEAGDALAGAIDAIVERMRRGGRLIYAGAGSSGALAALDAAECGPTFGSPSGEGRAGIADPAVVGPEVLAGSTRLKAGTAQKLVLNSISTVTMIRLGRTYGGLMVGVAPADEKLRERARRNVVIASGASEESVDEALKAAAGDAR